ncbi:DUF4188 domain-containing protein [Paracraurococcus ruber]|uniref:Transcriptional regulator n=1 Tax=Paracraurococcus ruber TaxID=77675 RepID=A0ABS1CZV0_9PROT|nr:DUF4188 domain-containing protein [Paracraurococcus ruber]MBK1660074.1 transcriptional regulator [Paracraurococcus ruber]TDG34055.1 DUF4188 domain-containing protein [Paracraurococcus ruber]
MVGIIPHRVCAEVEGEFVLFLIGARLNRPWKIHRWWPVLRAMPRMLAELAARPELGLLHHRLHGGLRSALVVQYWRSHALLQAYATARNRAHLPAWHAFNRAVGTNGDVGIWHETYLVGPGRFESVYVNMPPFGLGRAGALRDAVGSRATGEGRLAATAGPPGPAA